ncbi:hypothetical protein TNCV_764821 [Trichonephila clavipes]|nr:hypothetical protein TNCV_764821 [Trichonephila clavipes]
MNFVPFNIKQKSNSLVEKEYIETKPTLSEMFEKVSALYLLDCRTIPLEEFIAVDDDYMYTVPIVADKEILEFVKSSKNIIDADSECKNDMINYAPVPSSSEMMDIMKNMDSYLDENSNGEMNRKMDDIEQFNAKKDNT